MFITTKPALYLVNLSEKDYIRKKNKWLPKIKEWVDKNDPGAILIPFSGVFENKLADMEPDEKAKFLEENKITSALDKIIVQGYKALQLQYFFTSGPDEVKAWTIQKGTKAPQAAGRIHTDFEKGFIMAEVMKFDDFKEEGSEAAAKKKLQNRPPPSESSGLLSNSGCFRGIQARNGNRPTSTSFLFNVSTINSPKDSYKREFLNQDKRYTFRYLTRYCTQRVLRQGRYDDVRHK
ncbi:unnamed protein product [Nesidiocoris tenuis]|uniref:TGS domain-containing protein n=1 Tax=Nesidiocoris tenuis TaxID=355587 RepID=A0A6H5GA15_9HEMI|nr:unnamed protein product [Nesidiocoris tenuis]